MPIKIRIDRALCQGHSVCLGECPEVFSVEDTDDAYPQVVLLQESPPQQLHERVMAAARYCPNHVITVTEE